MATATAEATAVAAHRHDLRARSKMLDWFFFDRIDINRRKYAVREVVEGAVAVNMRLTESTLAMADLATPQAQVAACGAVSQFFLQPGLNQLIIL